MYHSRVDIGGDDCKEPEDRGINQDPQQNPVYQAVKDLEYAILLEQDQAIEDKGGSLIDVSPEVFETLTYNQRANQLKQLDFKSLSIPQQHAWLEVIMAQEDHLNLILRGCEVITNQHFLINTPQKSTFLGCILGNSLNPELHPSLRNLRSVDLTNCQNITDALIPQLAAGAVGLESLKLRNLSKLSKLQGPLLFPALQWLDVGGCFNLTKVHLEALCLWTLIAEDCPRISSLKLVTPLLKELDVRGMRLLTDKVLDQNLKGCPDIRVLKLKGCNQVHHQDIRQEYPQLLFAGASVKLANSIVALLRGDVTEISLRGGWNRVGDAGAQALAHALSHNTSLTTLSLCDSKISDAGAQALAQALSQSNTSLTSLDLGWNQIGDAGTRALSQSASLKTLKLSNNKIGDAGAQGLAYALSQNVPLTTPQLWRNKIGDAGAQVLEQALSYNAFLVALILSYEHINASLTSLELGGNEIGDTGAQALAQALSQNFSLTILSLWDNNIGVAGVQALAHALSQKTSLTTLNLRENKIGAEGARALAHALSENTSLTALYLGRDKIGVVGVQALAQALSQNTSLKILGLGNNNMGAAGAQALAHALSQNTSLTTLELVDNNMGAAGAQVLAHALSQNTSLRTLDLRGGSIYTGTTGPLRRFYREGRVLLTEPSDDE
jgi:Ran GTPase-activating protein (RanGAP) involved in mRNA processing and transport